jgi:hypothetical protein
MPLPFALNGVCPPGNQYIIYNYYCNIPDGTGLPGTVERTLLGDACRQVTPFALDAISNCTPVEAFIDTAFTSPPYPPVFYRCYWYSATPATTYETVAFEWSATSEYIEWYIKTIAIPNLPNSVAVLTGQTAIGFLVPLLKVTNHSPSLF